MSFDEVSSSYWEVTPEQPESGLHCLYSDCANDNTSEWKYETYVAADTTNDGLEKDEVGDRPNSWVMCGFFDEEPTVVNDSLPSGQDCIWDVTMEEADFAIQYPDASSSQRTLKTSGHNPDDNDADSSFSFSVSLVNFGVGISADAFYPSTDLTADSYEETTWKFDYGVTGESDLPTSPEDSIGVRWDFEGQNPGGIEAKLTHDLTFETIKNCARSGPIAAYTGTPDADFYEYVEVVE